MFVGRWRPLFRNHFWTLVWERIPKSLFVFLGLVAIVSVMLSKTACGQRLVFLLPDWVWTMSMLIYRPVGAEDVAMMEFLVVLGLSALLSSLLLVFVRALRLLFGARHKAGF